MPVPPAWVVALLASIALIGCGSDDQAATGEGGVSQDEYAEGVREAIGPVASESQDLLTRATEARRAQDLAEPLGEAQQVYQAAADQLESLEPPAEVEELHGDLVSAQLDIADAAGAAERAAREGNQRGLEQFRAAGDRYRDRAEELSQAFAERGFDF